MSANPYKKKTPKKKAKEADRPEWAVPFAPGEEAHDGSIHAALRRKFSRSNTSRLEMPLRLDSSQPWMPAEDGTLPPNQMLERCKYDSVVQSKLDEALMRVEAMKDEGNDGVAGDISLREGDDAGAAYVPSRPAGTRRVRLTKDPDEAAAYAALGGTIEMAGALGEEPAPSEPSLKSAGATGSRTSKQSGSEQLQAKKAALSAAEEARALRGMHGPEKPSAEALEKLEAARLEKLRAQSERKAKEEKAKRAAEAAARAAADSGVSSTLAELSDSEFFGRIRPVFTKLDRNGSDTIDVEEVSSSILHSRGTLASNLHTSHQRRYPSSFYPRAPLRSPPALSPLLYPLHLTTISPLPPALHALSMHSPCSFGWSSRR